MHEQHSEPVPASDQLLDTAYEIEVFSEQEARELFDEIARLNLGLSGDEFRERWHRGEFDDDPDRFEVMEVAMALPLVERAQVT